MGSNRDKYVYFQVGDEKMSSIRRGKKKKAFAVCVKKSYLRAEGVLEKMTQKYKNRAGCSTFLYNMAAPRS